MSVWARLCELIRGGLQLWPEGERLRYRAPQGLLAEADLRALRENKGEVLRLLRGRKAARLSSVQERLWFLSRLDSSGLGYTFTFAYRITGPLDAPAFTAALQGALRRHPGLSAAFIEVESHPIQLFDPSPTLLARCMDGRGEPWEACLQRMGTELLHPFDLADGPLLRSLLIRTGEQEHLWGLLMHHLVADGRTFGLFVRDVSRILSEGAPGEAPRLDYADYLEWERGRADSPEREANLRYWTKQLAATPDLDLPLDRPRPPARTHRGGQAQLPMPSTLLDKIDAFTRQEQASRFAVLLASWFALLYRYTGQEDFAVGSPHANRTDAGFEDTGGCFVSTLVLRADLAGSPSFRELVLRVGRVCMEAWDHQDYSYEQLVARLAPARDTSRNALFHVFFALQNVFEPLRVPGAHTEMVHVDTGVVQLDLEVHFFLGAAGPPTGLLLYNRGLFEEATIRGMAERWLRLTRALLEEPDRPIADIPLLSEDEWRGILAPLSAPAIPVPAARLDALFAAQAARTPARTAALCRGERLTYAELARRSAEMSGCLLALGARGASVGVFLERSLDMLIALLAIPGANAAFVPLDPALPPERLSFMIEDSGVRLVITTSTLSPALPDGVTRLLLDAPRPASARAASDEERGLDDVAYVLYTSGSTGRPKGVEVTHRNLVSFLHAMAQQPGIAEDDVLVAVTSLSFDISLLELLLPLLAGAATVLASRDEASDPAALAALIEASGATMMQATPSSWRMLLDAGWTGRRSLSALCGGEALSRDLADRLVETCGEVWNLYGPTETTIWSARWKVRRGEQVRIGGPIENTRFYVLDSRGEPVPPGLSGELWIAGEGVARGYLGRPEETARRFQDLARIVGRPERAYRTGDLVRRLPDGDLVFLGRADQQLKVRGHRVEPEEIEHALRGHPAVREAVAVLSPTGALVAHVLVQPSAAVSERALRDHAALLLPAFMVPQRCLFHADLPRTSNGKVDRKALSQWPLDEAPEARPYEPPADDEEAFVADLFAEVLDARRVGRWDDFFEMGGHSLVTARVLHGVKQRHGVDIGLHELFRASTVAALAARVREALARRADEERAIADVLDGLELMSEQEAARLLAQLTGKEGRSGP